MRKKLLLAGLFLGLTGIVMTAWNWSSVTDLFSPRQKPKTTFYFGLPETRVYSKSVVASPKSEYVFHPVLQFDLVEHDFMIRNTSKQVLELKKVKACCGSLVESYTRQIPAGKEGVIKLIILTNRRGGEEIHGTIRAETSDAEHPEWTIDITCPVIKFADISVHTIMLVGSLHETIEGSSMVIPTAEYPFRITGLKMKKGRDLACGHREITQAGKKGYLITARSVRKTPGVIRDTVYVQTDNPARPEFMIRVQGKLSE